MRADFAHGSLSAGFVGFFLIARMSHVGDSYGIARRLGQYVRAPRISELRMKGIA